MNQETLRGVQLIQLEIAKEVHRVCLKNNLCVFMLGGTLLGAVRHKGFIPWDDDFDFGMMRKDYDKFLEIAPIQLGEKYYLLEWKQNKDYPLHMVKIMKKGTIYKEKNRNDKAGHGIWVDLFAYDHIPENLADQKWQKRKLMVFRALARAKCKSTTWYTNNGIALDRVLRNIPLRKIK